jgi:hypothetical protein
MSSQPLKKNLIHSKIQTDATHIHLIRRDRETTSAQPALVIQGFKLPILNFNAFGVGAEMVLGLHFSLNQEMQGEFFQRGERILSLELRIARLTKQDGKDTAGFTITG